MKHIYFDDSTWVIAISPKDAEKVVCDQIGEEPDFSPERIAEWKQELDDKDLAVWFEEWHGKIDTCETVVPRTAKIERPPEKLSEEYTIKITAKAGAWAKSNKRQWLSSTEF